MAHDMAQSGVKERVSPEEWAIREDLAAAYRLVHNFGWDDLIYTHISARVPGEEHAFLLNPLGLTFDEICASNLVKIDHEGNKLMDSPWKVNRAGFVIHSAVHEARPDALCALHLHSDFGVAVSMQQDGLLPASQTAIIALAGVAYHDYEGIATRDDEKERLVKNLGNSFNLILRNHGTLSIGRSVGEAFQRMYFLEKACRYQILATSGGKVLNQVAEEAFANVAAGQATIGRSTRTQNGAWAGLRRRLDRTEPDYKD